MLCWNDDRPISRGSGSPRHRREHPRVSRGSDNFVHQIRPAANRKPPRNSGLACSIHPQRTRAQRQPARTLSLLDAVQRPGWISRIGKSPTPRCCAQSRLHNQQEAVRRELATASNERLVASDAVPPVRPVRRKTGPVVPRRNDACARHSTLHQPTRVFIRVTQIHRPLCAESQCTASRWLGREPVRTLAAWSPGGCHQRPGRWREAGASNHRREQVNAAAVPFGELFKQDRQQDGVAERGKNGRQRGDQWETGVIGSSAEQRSQSARINGLSPIAARLTAAPMTVMAALSCRRLKQNARRPVSFYQRQFDDLAVLNRLVHSVPVAVERQRYFHNRVCRQLEAPHRVVPLERPEQG